MKKIQSNEKSQKSTAQKSTIQKEAVDVTQNETLATQNELHTPKKTPNMVDIDKSIEGENRNERVTPSVGEQEFALRLELRELIESTERNNKSQKELAKQIKELTQAITLISEHEFTQIHRSKWSIFLYQLSLGMLFAIGTVLGLATFSWSVYTFFKDSEILRQIVDKQLNSRNFNFTEIREKAVRDAKDTNQGKSLSGIKNQDDSGSILDTIDTIQLPKQ